MTAPPLAAARSPAEIAKASGSSFLTSFVFLSPGRRRALLAVYAFCRVVDDAVDLAHARNACHPDDEDARRESNREARYQLDFWQNELDDAFAGKPRTPTGFALHRAAGQFDLEREPLAEVCAGCAMDLEEREYEDFAALEIYMRRVASAVGIACLPIFGADRDRPRPYAERLGIALQYTNIMRDLAEDGAEGRCYVPQDIRARHGVERAWLQPKPPASAVTEDGPIARMLREEHERARSLYDDAHAIMPAADKGALRPARIMGKIYADLLVRVTRLGPRILTAPRCRVPLARKLYLATFGLARR